MSTTAPTGDRELGYYTRALRRRLELSQPQVAELAGVSTRDVSRLERGLSLKGAKLIGYTLVAVARERWPAARH